ncbi:MAG: gas vesicle protein [Acidobacteriota bacterium]
MARDLNTKPQHSLQSTNLADILDRVLDKGVVIAGDIKIRLVDIELLTLQIRLVICSVDRAVDMGIDWWRRDPHLLGVADTSEKTVEALESRIRELESRLGEASIDDPAALEAPRVTSKEP